MFLKMRLFVLVILLWARVLVDGGSGEAWYRRQLNCGPTMTGVSISSLFILPTTTQIPQHIPPKISEYIQNILNRTLPKKSWANQFHKKKSLEGWCWVIMSWKYNLYKGSSWLEVSLSYEVDRTRGSGEIIGFAHLYGMYLYLPVCT